MATTIRDLLVALRPGGDVYLNDARFPHMLRLHKTSFIQTLETMADTAISFEVRNPENTAHYGSVRFRG